MSRLPQKRTSAIQTDARSENGDAGYIAEPPASAAGTRVGLGWRVCIFVWACGFGGLFLYEVLGLLWRVGKGMVGNAP